MYLFVELLQGTNESVQLLMSEITHEILEKLDASFIKAGHMLVISNQLGEFAKHGSSAVRANYAKHFMKVLHRINYQDFQSHQDHFLQLLLHESSQKFPFLISACWRTLPARCTW